MRFGLRRRSQNYAVKLDGIARNFKHRRIRNSFAAMFVLKFNSADGYFCVRAQTASRFWRTDGGGVFIKRLRLKI